MDRAVALSEAPGSCELENDLASIACRAAIALDNFILNRPADLSALQQLAETLSSGLVTCALGRSWNPAVLFVVMTAMKDSWSSQSVATLEELATCVQNIVEGLTQSAAGSPPAEIDLVRLRAFCLTLSKLALCAGV